MDEIARVLTKNRVTTSWLKGSVQARIKTRTTKQRRRTEPSKKWKEKESQMEECTQMRKQGFEQPFPKMPAKEKATCKRGYN